MNSAERKDRRKNLAETAQIEFYYELHRVRGVFKADCGGSGPDPKVIAKSPSKKINENDIEEKFMINSEEKISKNVDKYNTSV